MLEGSQIQVPKVLTTNWIWGLCFKNKNKKEEKKGGFGYKLTKNKEYKYQVSIKIPLWFSFNFLFLSFYSFESSYIPSDQIQPASELIIFLKFNGKFDSSNLEIFKI